jgi:hypothetical protein
MKNETTLAGGVDRLNAVFGQNFDFRPASRFGQTIDDGLGGVGDRKHATI